MEKVIMCASCITAIILCFIGIIKLPFGRFKTKHPKWYRFVFCFLSLALSACLPILCELYILKGALYSLDFLVLELTTVAGVFGLYTSYEGLGLKTLANKLVDSVKNLFSRYSDRNIAKTAEKVAENTSAQKAIVEKVGIQTLKEIAVQIENEKRELEKLKAQQTQVSK